MLSTLVGFFVVFLIGYQGSKAVVRNLHLGQLYLDTSPRLRTLNSFLILLLMAVYLLYLTLVHSIRKYNRQIYTEHFLLYDWIILVLLLAQGVVSMFLYQGLLFTILSFVLTFVSLGFSGKSLQSFVPFVLLALTVFKFARSNIPPYPTVLTYADIPIPLKEEIEDDSDYRLPNGPVIRPTSRSFAKKYEGVQLKKPK